MPVGRAVVWKLQFSDTPVSLGPGVKAAENLLQGSVNSSQVYQLDDYRVTPLATFKIKAKVLSRKDTGARACELIWVESFSVVAL